MKTIKLICALIAVVMLVGLTNCKKDLKNTTPDGKQYVEAINASFNVKDGDITFKSYPNAPVGVNRTWTMNRANGTLVNGSEFITGSAAQLWWSSTNPVNNPVTFSASQQVYSNLTPAEPVRLITETKDGNGNVFYLGILDFDPTQAQFPLTVNGFRLGDVLRIDTHELTDLPGGAGLTFTASFSLITPDIAATKIGSISAATGGAGAGVTGELGFSDIKYGAPLFESGVTIGIAAVNYLVFDSNFQKLTGPIVITINEPATGSTPANTFTVTIPDNSAPGKGRLFTLHTTKTGWYDSATVTMNDHDIWYESVTILVN